MIVFKIESPPTGPICDFCSGTPVVATHKCAPHVAGQVGGFTLEDADGLWAACAECDALIRHESWELLLDRSYKAFSKFYQIPEMKEHLRKIHDQFRKLRIK